MASFRGAIDRENVYVPALTSLQKASLSRAGKPATPPAVPAAPDIAFPPTAFPPAAGMATDQLLKLFRAKVLMYGAGLYRDLPWRSSRDPYAVWVSEVMLQQTQVARVNGRWQHWLKRFPTVESLAAASTTDVIKEWQGLGYNRRALALRGAAQIIVRAGGELPREVADLVKLPGIGPATAAGIRAFAWNLPGVYLETNVRTVFLHELFKGEVNVADSRLIPLVKKTCPPDACNPDDDPRTWYFALLDFGAYLKTILPNPSRRSRTHSRQSRFEGSHRQKRAELLRALLSRPEGADLTTLTEDLSSQESNAGRSPLRASEVAVLLAELTREGFCYDDGGIWRT